MKKNEKTKTMVKPAALFASVFLALVFLGCAKSNADNLKILNWQTQGEITTMDSAKGFDVLSWEQQEFFNEAFYKTGEDNVAYPALAAALPEVSADGLTVTITLRDGIKFSDGSAITADDFVYAARRVVDPATGSQSATRLNYIKNAAEIIKGEKPPTELAYTAISSNKVQITLVAPNPYINNELASVVLSPVKKAFVESKGDGYALNSDATLASGPFVLTGWQGASISWAYEKNPHYYDAEKVYFDKINMQVIKDISTGVALYEDGKLDSTVVSGEHITVYKDTPDLVSIQTLRMTNLELGISSNKYLQNLNFRKALLYAVDRKELSEAILNGDGVPAVGVIPDGIAVNPQNQKSIKEDFGDLTYTDIAGAQKYFETALKELGVSTITLRLVTSDSGESVKIGQYLQSFYETNLPGLKIDLANVPASVRFQEMMSYKFDLALGGWTGEFNPYTYPRQFEASNEHNHGKWMAPELTDLIKKLELEDGTDFATRWEHLRQANQHLIDNAVTVPLVQASKSVLINPKLKGYVKHVLGSPLDVTRAYF